MAVGFFGRSDSKGWRPPAPSPGARSAAPSAVTPVMRSAERTMPRNETMRGRPSVWSMRRRRGAVNLVGSLGKTCHRGNSGHHSFMGSLRAPSVLAALACALAPTAARADGREEFTVRPFANVKAVRSFGYLEAGLPAIVAERLGAIAPLRFVG